MGVDAHTHTHTESQFARAQVSVRGGVFVCVGVSACACARACARVCMSVCASVRALPAAWIARARPAACRPHRPISPTARVRACARVCVCVRASECVRARLMRASVWVRARLLGDPLRCGLRCAARLAAACVQHLRSLCVCVCVCVCVLCGGLNVRGCVCVCECVCDCASGRAGCIASVGEDVCECVWQRGGVARAAHLVVFSLTGSGRLCAGSIDLALCLHTHRPGACARRVCMCVSMCVYVRVRQVIHTYSAQYAT